MGSWQERKRRELAGEKEKRVGSGQLAGGEEESGQWVGMKMLFGNYNCR